jgi:hypothetical protein
MNKLVVAALAVLALGAFGATVRANAVDDYLEALAHTPDLPSCDTGSVETRLDCLNLTLRAQANEIFRLRTALRDVTQPRSGPFEYRR